MEIIAAIHIIDGQCVRLFKGDFDHAKIYSRDPLKQATLFEKDGADALHIIDLDATRAGEIVNGDLVKNIQEAVSIPVQIGGGIRAREDIEFYLENGIDRIILGTAAVDSEEFLAQSLQDFGPDKVMISVDSKKGLVVTKGWLETTDLDAISYAEKVADMGAKWIIHTDVYRDGTLTLPNFDDLDKLVALIPEAKIIASGGVSKVDHLNTLHRIGVAGVIVGKALYENKIRLTEIAGQYR